MFRKDTNQRRIRVLTARYAIGLLSALVFVAAGGLRAEEFVDDFEDGAHDDCSPLCWYDGRNPGNYDASSGDLRNFETGSLGLPATIEGDLSIRAVVNVADVPDGASFKTAVYYSAGRGPNGELNTYIGNLSEKGVYRVDLWVSGVMTRREEGFVRGFQPKADYGLQFDIVGDFVELRVWNTAEEPPGPPTLRVDDTTYRSGTVGISSPPGAIFRLFSFCGEVVSPSLDLQLFLSEVPGGAICMDVLDSTTPAGTQITSYFWDFGDGDLSREPATCHTYEPGVHLLNVAVTNSHGRTDKAYQRLIIDCADDDMSPWTLSSIGEPIVSPGARLAGLEESGEIVLCGGGALPAEEDKQPFLWQEWTGDVSLIVEITESAAQKRGVVLRESLGPGARRVGLMDQGATLRLEYRSVAGSDVEGPSSRTARRGWLRLLRQGDTFVGSASIDGVAWDEIGRVTIDGFGGSYLAGLTAFTIEQEKDLFVVSSAHFGSIAISEPLPPDCNHNGVADDLDLTGGTSADCNGNGVPDSCDVAVGTSQDCDQNGIPDACDIAADAAQDADVNGVLDACELPLFRRGDCDSSGDLDLTDGIVLLGHTFLGEEGISCLVACDVDARGVLDVTTAIYLFSFIFGGGPPPPEPFKTCGEPTTPQDQAIGCSAPNPVCR